MSFEAIMPPSTGSETGDAFTVTARGAFFIALVVGPLVAIFGATGEWKLAALGLLTAAAQSTHLIYRRVRRSAG